MDTVLIAAAVGLWSVLPAAPQVASTDISGAWELSVTTSRGVESGTLTLKKNGDKFSGNVVRDGTDGAPVEATVKDKTVTIVITTQTQTGPATFTLSGTVAADAMSGTGDFGARGSGKWSAKRSTAPGGPAVPVAVDVTGTWTLTVETAQGTGTPAFTFKQAGDKLSGQYRGLFGEAPVTGTINGSAIVFSLDTTVEGNTVRVTYSGTVEKDTMKGSVKLGDLAEGTFKGTRKR